MTFTDISLNDMHIDYAVFRGNDEYAKTYIILVLSKEINSGKSHIFYLLPTV